MPASVVEAPPARSNVHTTWVGSVPRSRATQATAVLPAVQPVRLHSGGRAMPWIRGDRVPHLGRQRQLLDQPRRDAAC